MKGDNTRRNFVKSLVIAPTLCSFEAIEKIETAKVGGQPKTNKLKTSLNAYSFNEPLSAKTMNLDELLEFCAEQNFDGVDLTGYYFPGYPQVPSDEYIYHLKRKAHLLGVSISGTGIRNDFTNPDPLKRKEDILLIKNWIEVAAKLGAPVLRIFSGVIIPKEYNWNQIAAWMASDIRECVAYGQQHGVIVAIQNHNDFILTADQVIKIIRAINSEWFGLILDTGSFRQLDAYAEIEKAIPYAVNWQVKEKIWLNGTEVETDLERLMKIIKASGYKGYLPIETLGAGDPKVKIPALLEKLKKAM